MCGWYQRIHRIIGRGQPTRGDPQDLGLVEKLTTSPRDENFKKLRTRSDILAENRDKLKVLVKAVMKFSGFHKMREIS